MIAEIQRKTKIARIRPVISKNPSIRPPRIVPTIVPPPIIAWRRDMAFATCWSPIWSIAHAIGVGTKEIAKKMSMRNIPINPQAHSSFLENPTMKGTKYPNWIEANIKTSNAAVLRNPIPKTGRLAHLSEIAPHTSNPPIDAIVLPISAIKSVIVEISVAGGMLSSKRENIGMMNVPKLIMAENAHQ
jgi:hypothetical protein